jgi:hypothetical protein
VFHKAGVTIPFDVSIHKDHGLCWSYIHLCSMQTGLSLICVSTSFVHLFLSIVTQYSYLFWCVTGKRGVPLPDILGCSVYDSGHASFIFSM